jgi:predicted  nucleic acid-binding Zn-ribbon protein
MDIEGIIRKEKLSALRSDENYVALEKENKALMEEKKAIEDKLNIVHEKMATLERQIVVRVSVGKGGMHYFG